MSECWEAGIEREKEEMAKCLYVTGSAMSNYKYDTITIGVYSISPSFYKCLHFYISSSLRRHTHTLYTNECEFRHTVKQMANKSTKFHLKFVCVFFSSLRKVRATVHLFLSTAYSTVQCSNTTILNAHDTLTTMKESETKRNKLSHHKIFKALI